MNHGSGLFMRGRTQVLVSTTLGGGDDESRIENILDTPLTTFMLHYNFLPFSVGEARPLRSIGRREVGHGYLAQNAIKAILPENKNFPYTIRLVADVLESDGSSSMATVCGSMMSLMDAGVPVKDMVAGIAMGMISGENKEFEILTDIAGIEDELGLMDFKVAGTKDNVTAIQMDIKYKGGLPREIFIKALEKAKIARLHIMEAMKKVMDKPNTSLSSLVPQFATINIPKDKIGSVIGSGGKTIREITEKTETSINIEDTGLVKIFGKPGENFNKAISWIKMIVGEVVIGTSFNNATIKKITEFGLFVELFPNFDGLVHISSIPKQEQDSIKNNYREGDKIKVVVIDYDPITSRIRLKIVK
jgi:polyribonucleotide nucleotidyltransferase